jgi:hypothetical protein
LQQNPARELLLEKMRSKLATTPAAAVADQSRKREVRKRDTGTWFVRALMLLGFIAVNYSLIGHKDAIAAKIGMRAVASLPSPEAAYGKDEQALYYTYALYDWSRFKEKYGTQGSVAVDQADARKRLEALLPDLQPQTLGIISAYMPVAFRSVAPGSGN